MKGHSNFRAIQLQNNFGLTDQAVIGEAEALFTTMAAIQGMPKGDFGIEHFKSIHKHILGDMYPWAGEFRTAKLSVGDNYAESAAPPALLELEVGRVLTSLKAEPADAMNAVEFADKMAMYYTKLYALSPFPDGNARAARFMVDAFAEKHQMQVAWEKVPAEAFHAAVKQSLNGNSSGLRQVFRAMTDHQDLYALHSVDAIQGKVAEIAVAAGLRDGYMPSQSIASHQDLGKLAGYVKMRLSEDLKAFAAGGSTLRDWEKTSIQHEIHGKVDRQSTGPEALNRALESIQSPSGPRNRLPGL
jgi:fido (protein-threonine AMPylation protein)